MIHYFLFKQISIINKRKILQKNCFHTRLQDYIIGTIIFEYRNRWMANGNAITHTLHVSHFECLRAIIKVP